MWSHRRTFTSHPPFVAPRSGSRRNRSGETRYLEVSDLGSVGELTVVISWFARFYEASGASARKEQTSGPVETKHPQNLEHYGTDVRIPSIRGVNLALRERRARSPTLKTEVAPALGVPYNQPPKGAEPLPSLACGFEPQGNAPLTTINLGRGGRAEHPASLPVRRRIGACRGASCRDRARVPPSPCPP